MRLIRVGPAKRKKAAKAKELSDSDTEHGACLQSEFEEKDEDLWQFLQSNTSFLMAMHSTNAFTVPGHAC